MFDKVFEGDYNPGKDDIITVRMPETMLKVLIALTDMSDGTGEKLKEKGDPETLLKILMLHSCNGILVDQLKSGERETQKPKERKGAEGERKAMMRKEVDRMKETVKMMTEVMERMIEKDD